MVRRLIIAALIAGCCGCAFEAIHEGDSCAGDGDRICRTQTVGFYCDRAHWFETDCWVVCKTLGYEVGSCGFHSRFGDGVCLCAPTAGMSAGQPCVHEGDQTCGFTPSGDQVLYACVGGLAREIDCAAACGGHVSGACGYDAARGDDSCICCDTPACP